MDFMDRKQQVAAQIGWAKTDAFDAAVRTVAAEAIANALRDAAGNAAFNLGDVDPAIVRRIADEVESYYAR